MESLTDGLVQMSFATTAVLNRVAAAHDLSLTQLRTLGILRDRRLRISELADFLGLERSTLSGLIDRAAARGLLTRAPSAQDGRVVEVVLTEDGAELAGRVADDVADALIPLIAPLSRQDRATLRALLDRVVASHTPETSDRDR
ncbi:hypothetical protein GCM10027169_02640 [Gordonia jinhuaensis]|uniref:HTH marR-type domain-containing protein n=1 Tax=Gordonia jinhuaensis TaxID=1517702 RepID=A0A916T3C5_9ACTN|nr:MarR family transcriptional regulator [Gordonia jinhuaensis]GGB28727.1 hypothetical protein GCM10011489_16180 [Gordonia jinhuaensis]